MAPKTSSRGGGPKTSANCLAHETATAAADQRVRRLVVALEDEPLLAGIEVGVDDRAPVADPLVELRRVLADEHVDLAAARQPDRQRLLVGDAVRDHAGDSPRRTPRQASYTSDSTQPPETEPSIEPSSPTTSFEPTGRGAERRVAMTVATAERFTRSTLAAPVLAEAVVALGRPPPAAGAARREPLRLDEQRVHQRGPEDEVRKKHPDLHVRTPLTASNVLRSA